MMADLAAALRERISALEDEREELEASLNRVTARIGVLEELLVEEEEGGAEGPAPKPKKKRGRPKGSKNKKTPAKAPAKETKPEDEELLREASKLDGTPADVAERLSKRKFTPVPRPQQSYGPGVHPGVGGPGNSGPGVGDDDGPVSGQQ